VWGAHIGAAIFAPAACGRGERRPAKNKSSVWRIAIYAPAACVRGEERSAR